MYTGSDGKGYGDFGKAKIDRAVNDSVRMWRYDCLGSEGKGLLLSSFLGFIPVSKI
jgi:hypothetical protein